MALYGIGENRSAWDNIQSYPSYEGLLGAIDDYQPEKNEPEEWSRYGLAGFGYLLPQLEREDGRGYIPGEMLGGLSAEVDDSLYQGYARTPMIELSGADYRWINRVGRPYDGMLGLGDDGQVYVYDGLHGFFKKLFRKAKKGIKRVAKRIKKVARKVIKKLPGGKTLLKIGGKLKKITMKVIKPVTRFVGKYAKKLAPIAAVIPGYGPAIAAGLRVAGKVANVSRKFMGYDAQPRMWRHRQQIGTGFHPRPWAN